MSGIKINLEALKSQLVDGVKGEAIARAESADYAHKAKLAALQLQRISEENSLRKQYSDNIFTVTVIWMFLILLMVVACGQKTLVLSDSVIIALITTTTANVAGFLYVVVNYLFNKDKST